MAPGDLSAFRQRVRQAREDDPPAWERSRHLVRAEALPITLSRLSEAIRKASLPPEVTDALLSCLPDRAVIGVQELPGDRLKELTGLPATKAVRALCVLFGLVETNRERPLSSLPVSALQDFIDRPSNPYDLLLEAEAPSLLDLGAGDLSCEEELVEQYRSALSQRGKRLVVHAVDRLAAGSQLGGPLHPPHSRLERLSACDPTQVEFRFWENQDMFALESNAAILPTYTIVTCHAPATPTFAYEPARLSRSVIADHLRATKGVCRPVRIGGEPALEVLHEGKALLFPPWKFEIRGPLALLDLLARRATVAVLSSIDSEVFWELLAQLVADPVVRPRDTVFTAEILRGRFGDVYERLTALRPGELVSLADLTGLRRDLPRVLRPIPSQPTYAYRAVHVRRGATFPGMPASFTARVFKDMRSETLPWCVVLVP